MNTTENNKLIAEFMGLKIVDGYLQKHTDSNTEPKKYWEGKPNTFEYQIYGWQITHHESKIKFHSDWNWLMSVVDKIESVDNGKITLIFQQKSCLIWDNNRGEELEYFDGSFKSETKIGAVYTAVVEFIKWYNLNK